MAEVRLFGKTISVLAVPGEERGGDKGRGEEQRHKDIESPASEAKSEPNTPPQIAAANDNIHKQSPSDDQQATNPEVVVVVEEEDEEAEEDSDKQNNNGKLQDNKSSLKKPDKILPCPRCSSLDTKFCYFNNYNVNQPRHFCKNCQRYWTAGGTMRNVPIGAGRRKSKSSLRHFKHITISAGAAGALLHNTRVSPGGEVLTFSDVAAVHKLQHPPIPPPPPPPPPVLSDAKAPFAAVSFGDQSELVDSTSPTVVPHPHPHGGHYATASVGNDKAPPPLTHPPLNGGDSNSMSCCPPQVLAAGSDGVSTWLFPPPAAAELISSFTSFPPLPFYHHPPSPCWGLYPSSPYWGCAPFQLVASSPAAATTTSSAAAFTGARRSPPLGKHPRGDVADKDEEGGSLWIPKTLRIDNPEEAAKSSIWTTIGGIMRDKTGGIRGRLFDGFQHKERELEAHKEGISKIMQANPAAMARSLNFQESV